MTDLDLLKLVNRNNINILPSQSNTDRRFSTRYKAAEGKEVYRGLVHLLETGVRVPYHHRAKCPLCSHYFYPGTITHMQCSECEPDNKQKLSLSPADCLEVDMTYPEMCEELGLPNHPELYSILDEWDERNEDASIKRLEAKLAELFERKAI